VVTLLGDALADGRLTADEHAERMERAYASRTLGELATLTVDLTPAEQQPVRVDGRAAHALFSSLRRSGRWVVPARFPVTAVVGTVELDLREAILQRRHIVIEANVLCGTVHLLVPEGVRVEVTTRMILSSRAVKIRSADGRVRQDGPAAWPGQDGQPAQDADLPVIEIAGTMVLGSINVRTPKRTWRQRLRRSR
jgi:uncharacterized protein DUF1707/cell wall-active antibiotic response 4TMS protein YvqF